MSTQDICGEKALLTSREALVSELRKGNERLNILSDMASALLLSDNPRDVIEIVFEKLSAHLGLEAYFNYLLIEDGSRMRLANYRGIPPETAAEIEWLDFGQAVCGCVARDRERIIAEDVQHSDDSRTDLIRSLGITAYCCHPLIAHDRLIGTLSFGTRKRPRFTDDEVGLLCIACNYVATALDRQGLIVQLQKARDGLEQRVKERTVDLSSANTALKEANEALKSEISERVRVEAELREAKRETELYIDLMGHDISNMHQIIMAELEMAEEMLATDGKIDDSGQELIQAALATLRRSAKLIENVRKLQELKQDNCRLVPVNLRNIIADAARTYSEVPGKEVGIQWQMPDGAYVLANPLITDIFGNLLENSIKYSDSAVTIGISVTRAWQNGIQYYRVAVEDDGNGIPDSRKATLFTRFSRGNSEKGIGLGLYLVRMLAENFKGFIQVEDRVPGDYTKGTRFLVYLPTIESMVQV